ncbi:MAG: hypothetical protein V4525_02140 [Pseudomonadota bacterium]
MYFRFILALSLLTQVVGCASIVSGQNQSISIQTRTNKELVEGANCKLSNNKGAWFVKTPGSVTVRRSYQNLSISCEKENYETGTTFAKSSTKGMAFGNLLFGGIVGAGVDMSTGAAYDYPNLISVNLVKRLPLDTSSDDLAPQSQFNRTTESYSKK